MNHELTDYAKIGLVHHMLYPECGNDPALHIDTLLNFVKRRDINTFDFCLPYETEQRSSLIEAVCNCGKTDITFATHFFPLKKLGFSEPDQPVQAQIRMIVSDLIDQAAACGASNFIFASGGPAPEQAGKENFAAFKDFCRWLCTELGKHGITALLEPFDTQIDKKYLYGSSRQCVELLDELTKEFDNIGIELDLAHVPLMGESFEHAVKTVAPYLKRVHLGNCVLKDTSHPRYGDTHPPCGFPGGEIDTPELTEILELLMEVEFLNKDRSNGLVMEMTPWPGKSVEDTIADSFSRLRTAWDNIA